MPGYISEGVSLNYLAMFTLVTLFIGLALYRTREPTHFFREKLLFKKGTVLCDKHFAFGSVIEGIPNSFLRVSYEDAFSALVSSLSG